jgi:protein O-GlcNAc transferase
MNQATSVDEAFRIAIAHHDAGRLPQAEKIYRQILANDPNHVRVLDRLAKLAAQAGRPGVAIELIRRVIALIPDSVEAHSNLAMVLRSGGKFDEAADAYRQVLRINPNHTATLSDLSTTLLELGQLDESLEMQARAIAARPMEAGELSARLLALNYCPTLEPARIFDEHREWDRRHGVPLIRQIQPHLNDRDPERRLRVGYLSADFREHPVSRFLLPLMQSHDHEKLMVVCYSNTDAPDTATQRFRELADEWRNIAAMPDEDAAELIRRDRIDLLVELAGHTSGNRLTILARKPAPVQATYLGYPNTTGLQTVDYRFTDALADPPGKTEAYHSEQLVRLNPCAWCYEPRPGTPAVAPLPARTAGVVTFGSFNHLAKANDGVLHLWGRLLANLPGSRLVLKDLSLAGASTRQRILAILATEGVAEDRVSLLTHVHSYAEHLSLYGRIDIALDPFPYNGTTTTCDAFWMGVPIIALAGQTHVARVGVSLLNAVGLSEWVAQTPEEYVRIAKDMAGDIDRLDRLRQGMRARMQSSPLMDAPRFARTVEVAYRQIWRNWCGATR